MKELETMKQEIAQIKTDIEWLKRMNYLILVTLVANIVIAIIKSQ